MRSLLSGRTELYFLPLAASPLLPLYTPDPEAQVEGVTKADVKTDLLMASSASSR